MSTSSIFTWGTSIRMVMTRRASLLERERQQSESVVVVEEPEAKPEIEVASNNVRPQSIPRESPSLLRPTPQPQEILTIDDDVAQAMSAITIKDEPVDIDEKLALPPADDTEPIITSTSTTFSIQVNSPRAIKNEVSDLDSEDEEEARDTVGVMRSVRALPARARRTSSAGSVVSVEDAKTSIDDFMTDRVAFTADEDNKLRFWQSLCIEFRLVKIDGGPIPLFDQLSLDSTTTQSWSDNQDLPPVPTSCTEAKKLLKAKAHVNLVDYFKARSEPLAQGEERDYTHLLFASRQAVVDYTRKHRKYISREDAKEDLLQPLLKTMRRGARR